MFWTFLLCHLIADYPLQTDGMVQAKNTWPGLIAHVTIHLSTLLVVLFGPLGLDVGTYLPIICAMTAAHFAIDAFKKILSQHKSHWIIRGYILDQFFHIVSIWLIAFWGQALGIEPMFTIPASWLLYASGYILVTHVCYVTGRIVFNHDKKYQTWHQNQMWTRMVTRSVIYTAVLIGWNPLGIITGITGLLLGWYDRSDEYRWRSLFADLVTALSAIFATQFFLS